MKKYILVLIILFFPITSFAKTPTLLNHLGNDARYTFASWPMLLILGGGIASVDLSYLDDDTENHFRDNQISGKFDKTADILGSAYVIDPGALLTYAAGHLSHNETLKTTGETLLEALFLTESSTLAMKEISLRPRPNGGNLSFPSGHAARTFAVAGVLETLHGPFAGIPAFLAAGLISFSRLDSNDHHLSDVVFGATWGTAIGWGTARFHNKIMNEKLSFIPSYNGNPGFQVVYRF